MGKMIMFWIILQMYSCAERNEFNESVIQFKNNYGLKGKELLLINWDNCSSCHAQYGEIIQTFSKVKDIDVVVISNRNRNINADLIKGNVKFIDVKSFGQTGLVISIPSIILVNQDGFWSFEGLDIMEFTN